MKIYRNGVEIYEIKDFKVIGRFMEVATLDCTIKSPTPIAFGIGDYVTYDYNNLTYSLYDIPAPKKQARSGSYGEAFIYNLKFKSNMEHLVICPFLDLVANDNTLHYTSLPSFSTFENVYGIAARIQANMDYLYPGKWRIVVGETSDSELLETLNEAKEFAISGQSCFEGLRKIYDTWGVGYIYSEANGINTITIGKSAGTTSVFRYGKGQGLRTIGKNIQNNDQFCTRAYVFGSTRNLPARWYNEKGYIGEAQYAPNLMIPFSKWVGGIPQGAYIDAIFGGENRVEKYGLRIKTFSYDGSGNNEEIYPSIEKVTAGNIRSAKAELGETKYIPSSRYSNSERMDYILEGSSILDDGVSAEAGYELYSEKLTASVEEIKESIIIAEPLKEEKYKLLSFQKNIVICSFDITKSAIYQISEIAEMFSFSKNDLESTISAKWYMQTPDGSFIDLKKSLTFTDKLQASLQLPQVTFEAKEAGKYTLVLRLSVGWSVEYVVPQINGDIFLTYAVNSDSVEIARGTRILSSTFTLKLKQIGFDLNSVTASDGSKKTITMKDGMCGGRSFVIRQCKYSTSDDSWELVCSRVNDSSVSQTFPNSIFPISAGDQFVLLNINMPDLYVHTAMQRLYDTALADLKHYSIPQFVVSPEIDNLQMARSPQILREGMYMPIEDSDIDIDEDILIDSVTITEKGTELRSFSVTLRNDKIYNRFSKIATSISNLESSIEEAKKNTVNTPVADDSTTEVLIDSNVGVDNYFELSPENEVKTKEERPLAGVEARFDNYALPVQAPNVALGRSYLYSTDPKKHPAIDLSAVKNDLDKLNDLGLSLVEQDGKTWLRSEYDFFSEGEVSSGGASDTEGEGGSGGSVVTVEQIVTDANGVPIAKINVDGVPNVIYAPRTAEVDLSGYATTDYVNTAIQNAKDTRVDTLINTTIPGLESDIAKRALQSDLTALQTSHNALRNDFDALNTLLNDDVSEKIDTWNEVVDFLDEYSGSQDLATILSVMNADIAKRALQTSLDATNANLNNHIDTFNTFVDATNNTLLSHNNRIKTFEDIIGIDDNGDVYIKKKADDTARNFYSFGEVSSGGLSDTGGSTGGNTVSWDGAYESGNLLGTLYIDGVANTILGPTALPNPYALTINGEVYDGSKAVDITISGGVSGDYLPITGGVVSGTIYTTATPGIILKRGEDKNPYLRFTNLEDVNYGEVGVTPDGSFAFCPAVSGAQGYGQWNTVIHSGNIGFQSVNYANSAGVLSSSYANQDINLAKNENKIRLIYSVANNSTDLGYPTQYSSGISVLSGYTGWQMVTYGGTNTPNPFFRLVADNGSWLEWKQLAFLTDNVASATKLQTARSIWGQSFDGSGDVNGNITPNAHNTYSIGSDSVAFHRTVSNYLYSGSSNNLWLQASNGYGIYFVSGATTIGTWSSSQLVVNTPLQTLSTIKSQQLSTKGDSSISHLNVAAVYSAVDYIGIYVTGGTNPKRPLVLQNDSAGYGNVLIGTTEDVMGKLQVSGSNCVISADSNTADCWQYFKVSGVNKASVGYYNKFAFISNEGTYARIGITDAGVPQFWTDTTGAAGKVYNLLHTGNYSSYALPLSGGTMNGTITTDATPGMILRRANPSVPYIRFTDTANTTYGEIGVRIEGHPCFYPTIRVNNGETTASWKNIYYEGADITNAAGGIFIHRTNEINCFTRNLYLNHRGNGSDSNGTTGNVVMCANGGNVVIGNIYNAEYTTKFQVGSDTPTVVMVDSTNANECGVRYTLSGANKGWVGYYTSYGACLYNYTSKGYAGIGDDGVFRVTGNFVATGEVTSGSDARYKRIESYAEIDINTIANAPIINFRWADREDDKLHLGSTAQYWYNTSLLNGVSPTDDEKLWTMGYGQIALASAVSIAKKVVNHEDRLQIVEKELAVYKAENQMLKQLLNQYRYGIQ